jgi:hypothetical protein
MVTNAESTVGKKIDLQAVVSQYYAAGLPIWLRFGEK